MRTRIDMPAHLLALGTEQAGVLNGAQLAGLPTGTVRRLRDGWEVLGNGLSTRRTLPDRLLEALSARQRLRQRSVIEDMCGAAGQGIESVLEWRYRQRVEQRHNLPALERQALLGYHARLDGFYREFNLAVELDGRSFHNASKDMIRDNHHVLHHGVDTLRYDWHAVTTQPCIVAAQVVQALTTRGWNGSSRRCGDCPPA